MYAALCQGEVDTAVKMLVNLGKDPAKHLHRILLLTLRRSVRAELLRYFDQSGKAPISPSTRDFLAHIESAYPLSFIPAGSHEVIPRPGS